MVIEYVLIKKEILDTEVLKTMITFYIREIREKQNLSQKSLAKLSGVSSSHIGYIENGDREPTITILCKIAKALKVEVTQLFKYEE